MATKSKLAAQAAASNADLWNALRAQSPSFASHTAEATAALFSERGFAQLAQTDPKALSDFFGLSVRAALQIVNISHAADPLADQGVGETFEMPYGGIIQRMATTSVKPTSPRYKGLKNGQSVDRWTVRKPETMERFWKQNFDYQSFITLQEFDMKQIFISEYGMSEYLAGIMAGLENGYVVQRYLNKMAAINAAIHDPNIRSSQRVVTGATDFTDPEQAKKFLYSVSQVATSMKVTPQTTAYNSMGYADRQDLGRLKLLVRAGFSDAMRIFTLVGAFNPEDLDLRVDVVEVENFGGITYTYNSGTETAPVYSPLYPFYDEFGAQAGWSKTENADAADFAEGDPAVIANDPNSNVQAILMDQGFIFETIQNAYRVLPTGLNEAGLYENFWASAPNNQVGYDRLYTFVEFLAEAPAA